MNLIQCMQTNSRCYRKTSTGIPVGILWHDTGAGNPEIRRYVQPMESDSNYSEMIAILGKNSGNNDWNHREISAGVNAWIGKIADGSVATVQSMPWDFKPWGCGSGGYGSCNGLKDGRFWIQFEICDDFYSDKDYFDKVYKEACELTAYLCKIFEIDPFGTVECFKMQVPTILCHRDSYKFGLGSGHGDVYKWFNKYGKTMDDVRKDVKVILDKMDGPQEDEVISNEKKEDLKENELPKDSENIIEDTAKPIETITLVQPRGNCKVLLDILQENVYGNQVKRIQQLLALEGYMCGRTDGVFDKRTTIAVKQYQRDNNLDADGIVGSLTWTKLLTGK